MILHALAEYYDRKSSDPSAGLPPFGWVNKHVDYLIVLSPQGACVNIEQKFSIEKGKYHYDKMYILPAIGKQAMKHTNSGKDANLLWDNSSFVFGLGNKGEIKRSSFISALDEWFTDLDDPGVNAVKLFYQSLYENESMVEKLIQKFGLEAELDKRDPTFTFLLQGDVFPVNYRREVKAAYEENITELLGDGIGGTCLLTGKENVQISKNETVIKGVWGGQTAGTNLIAFNERAFESYGKTKRAGENAPVDMHASFAYTTALNYLLRKGSTQRMQIGDASTVFWSEKQSDMETTIVSLFDQPQKDNSDNVKAVQTLYKSIQNGRYCKDDGDTRFYVLGLAPNAARIAVRFWHVGTVAEMSKRIAQYFEDLRIDRHEKKSCYLPLYSSKKNSYALLNSLVLDGDPEKVPPNLAGDVIRSILEGFSYPQTLLSAAVRRNKSDQNVTFPRASLIKAYLNRLSKKEEIKVSLDEQNNNIGYRLGRLFAVLEKIQEDSARPGKLNTTIRDSSYGAASATPSIIFSRLIRLSNHHLSKIKKGKYPGSAVIREKEIISIMGGLEDFPAHLRLSDQGRFAVGYYHQRQGFFKTPEPKEKNDE